MKEITKNLQNLKKSRTLLYEVFDCYKDLFVPFVQQSEGSSAQKWNSATFQQSNSMTGPQSVREFFWLIID